MYAVIKTGGKQYKVVAGEKLKIEQIPADIGSELTIDQVLAVGEGESIKFGAPLVEGASVRVTVISQGRHDKVRIFKMRRRKHYQKRHGPSSELHRNPSGCDQRLIAARPSSVIKEHLNGTQKRRRYYPQRP
jgi:large subunit ribosomal protein L21